MTPAQLYVYTEELYIHVQLALSNYQKFLNLVNNSNSRQTRQVWAFLQSFLSHFGIVSNLLYAPSSNKKISKDRARALREFLITDNNSALFNKDARNAVEHIDERMDNWLGSKNKSFLENVFENKEDYSNLDNQRWMIRRVYLIKESVFITEDKDGPKEMTLKPIVNELNRLSNLCFEKLDGNNPYKIIQPSQD